MLHIKVYNSKGDLRIYDNVSNVNVLEEPFDTKCSPEFPVRTPDISVEDAKTSVPRYILFHSYQYDMMLQIAICHKAYIVGDNGKTIETVNCKACMVKK